MIRSYQEAMSVIRHRQIMKESAVDDALCYAMDLEETGCQVFYAVLRNPHSRVERHPVFNGEA